jgi:hypothetical protein
MVWRLPELQKMPRIYVAPSKFRVSRGTTPCTKIKMSECKEPCELREWDQRGFRAVALWCFRQGGRTTTRFRRSDRRSKLTSSWLNCRTYLVNILCNIFLHSRQVARFEWDIFIFWCFFYVFLGDGWRSLLQFDEAQKCKPWKTKEN